MCVGRFLTTDQVLHYGDVVSRSDVFGTTATRTPVSRTVSINVFYEYNNMTFCVEQESGATEGATQQDVNESYQLMQQQLKQANETIATLMEQLSRVQPTS